MKYFLTGATGFIGGELAHQLVQGGHSVVALVRSPAKAQALKDLGVSLAEGDITEKESLRAPMRGVDGVFHVAGWYKVGTPDKTLGQKINVDGTRNVLEMMRELDIPRGVYTSTLAIHSDTHGKLVDETYRFNGRHLSEYDRTKAEAHQLAEEMIAGGLPLVITMPGVVYGPGDTSTVRTTFVSYLQRKLPLVPKQTGFCWVHVEDVAAGHRLAMEKGRLGQAYHLCGPLNTLVEALEIARQITGIPRPLQVPPSWVLATSKLVGLVDPFVRLPENYTSEGLRIVAGVTYAGDNSKARRELGFQVRPLEEGLRALLKHEQALLKV